MVISRLLLVGVLVDVPNVVGEIRRLGRGLCVSKPQLAG